MALSASCPLSRPLDTTALPSRRRINRHDRPVRSPNQFRASPSWTGELPRPLLTCSGRSINDDATISDDSPSGAPDLDRRRKLVGAAQAPDGRGRQTRRRAQMARADNGGRRVEWRGVRVVAASCFGMEPYWAEYWQPPRVAITPRKKSGTHHRWAPAAETTRSRTPRAFFESC